MKIDVTNYEDSTEIIFFNDEIKTEEDKFQVMNLIACFAADFELDPELEVSDIDLFISKAQEQDQTDFKIIIDEEGITVDLEE